MLRMRDFVHVSIGDSVIMGFLESSGSNRGIFGVEFSKKSCNLSRPRDFWSPVIQKSLGFLESITIENSKFVN